MRLKRIAGSALRSARTLTRSSRLSRPVFLVGTVRSGTTLLARSLGSHPDVHYAGFELSEQWSEEGGVEIACPETSDAHCPQRLADSYDPRRMKRLEVTFARVLAGRATRGARLLNKSPHLWNKLELVRAVFPDASLVITSRDIPSTVVSTLRLWQWLYDNHGLQHYLPHDETSCWDVIRDRDDGPRDPDRLFPGGGPEVIAEYWLRCYERIEKDRHLFPVQHCVRLQDFANSPGAVIGDIASELSLKSAGFEMADSIDPTRVSPPTRDSLGEAGQERLDAYLSDVTARIDSIACADAYV